MIKTWKREIKIGGYNQGYKATHMTDGNMRSTPRAD